MPGPFEFDTEPCHVEVTHRQAASVNGFLSGVLKLAAILVLLPLAVYLSLPIIDGVIRVKKAADQVEQERRHDPARK